MYIINVIMYINISINIVTYKMMYSTPKVWFLYMNFDHFESIKIYIFQIYKGHIYKII